MTKNKLIVPLMVLFILLGFRFYDFYSDQPVFYDGQEINITTTLLEEPEETGTTQKFRVITENGLRIFVFAPGFPDIDYGDRIKIEGKLGVKNFENFTYYSIGFPDIQVLDTEQNFLTRFAATIRGHAKQFFEGNLAPNAAGLLNGIVFGARGGLPDDYMESLRSTGVLHVIAASGMNVTFIAGWFMAIFGRIMKRQVAILATIAVVIFYAFLAGFDASIVRASVMGVIAFSAGFFGRQNIGILALFITGFAMLMYAPFYLSDVGFQLSFLSTLGILILKPFMDNAFEKIKGLSVISDDIGTTISAQIMALPVLLGTFGNYGLLSIIVNALVLWTVPFLMVIGALSLIVSFFIEPVGRLILLLSYPILLYFEYMVRFFGDLDLVITIENSTYFIWIGYYLILTGLIYAINLKRKNKNTRKTQKTRGRVL